MVTYGDLLAEYKRVHGKLVEPVQGWDSLHEDLWLAYSMGRQRGFTDLGTYVNKEGDHGGGPQGRGRPAMAFDLGHHDRFLFKGWDYLKARRLAKRYVKYHRQLKIDYVILGRRIWSREKPYWHAFDRDDSHMFHIHVSGWWPAKDL